MVFIGNLELKITVVMLKKGYIMKNIISKIALVFIVLFASSSVKAYRWQMTSQLNKMILVQVELLGSNNPYFVLVAPGGKADFNWSFGNAMAGFCLGKIKYVLPDENMLNQTSIIKNKNEVVDNKKMLTWLDQNESKYPRREADLKFLYKKQERTDAKSQALSAANPDTAMSALCTSRDDIIITEENGMIVFKAKS